MKITRREFLTGASALGATVALGGARSVAQAASPKTTGSSTLPDPAKSGIEHIVVLCMENRSFDHYLGWVRGAEGRQAGLSYPDESGLLHDTHHLQDWSGCGFNDPNHGYNGGHAQLNGGGKDRMPKGGQRAVRPGHHPSAPPPPPTPPVEHYPPH